MELQKHTNLSEHTSIKLGGVAKHFTQCDSVEELQEALEYAKENKLEVYILAGGSNTIFPDKGFDGLVVKIDLKGVSYKGDLVTAAAGVGWDDLVQECIKKDLAGMEALSGIPGSVGATPIQNVGAYGQEVGDIIQSVKAIDRETLKEVEFTNKECEFGYRTSRFKTRDKGKYIITEVVYGLKKHGAVSVAYDQLKEKAQELFGTLNLNLKQVREAVLLLRKSKSMVLDAKDPNSVSCGSFFVNPVLSQAEFEEFVGRWEKYGGDPKNIPAYEDGIKTKISAAWLIEQTGYTKGHKHGKAGLSDNHNLAIINRGGTTAELLELSQKIQDAVRAQFGITLEREPVVVE